MRSRRARDDARRAAQHVDDDDLIGQPALGADAPPERHALAEARERRAVGLPRGRRRRSREHRRLRHAGRHEQHAAPRASPPALRSATTATRPPSSGASAVSCVLAPRLAVEQRRPPAVELLVDGVLPGTSCARSRPSRARGARPRAPFRPPVRRPACSRLPSGRAAAARTAPRRVPDGGGPGQRERRRQAAGGRRHLRDEPARPAASSWPPPGRRGGRRPPRRARCRRRPAAPPRCRSAARRAQPPS